MKIKSVSIKYIKGIKDKTFNLDLNPNKPNIFVASNGFGKSSFATAFEALNKKRINLKEEWDCYKNKDTNNNKSEIKIVIEEEGQKIKELIATNKENEIDKYFDIFTINGSLFAKSKYQNRGDYNVPKKALLSISPIILKKKIPENCDFQYKLTEEKIKFGNNAKVLVNLNPILRDCKFVIDILACENFKKLNNKTNQKKILSWIENIRLLEGTKKSIIKSIDTSLVDDIFKDLREIVKKYLPENRKTKCNLLIYQLHRLSIENKKKIPKILKYKKYLIFKKRAEELLASLGSTWKSITPKETKGKFILVFPDIRNISNGERDIISFVAKLLEIEEKVGNKSIILIIDEVFDYLDDANIVICQFYITKFIENLKKEKKFIFPIMMTHLNPYYFKNYTFSRPQICFLEKKNIQINKNLSRIIEKRYQEKIKDDLETYFLHFHNKDSDISNNFKVLGLTEALGKKKEFLKYIKREFNKYIKDNKGYNPLAVCIFLRIEIEKYSYEKLKSRVDKVNFLTTKRTRQKLLFAEEKGVKIPEIFYLLGIIYNEGFHIHNNQDWITPLQNKLNNIIIKNIIKDVVVIINE